MTINIAVVGLGKMGISHLAIFNALDDFQVVAVCDSSNLVGSAIERHSGLRYLSNYDEVLKIPELHAIVIATPTKSHESMVRSAIDRGLHVFCEKPLTLSSEESIALCALARERGCVVQVGYHNRFVATFAEVKRIIASGSLGKISHALAESYGPVVLKPAKRTWRSKAEQGGGCLYDYAAHPINLLNWFFGDAEVCTGAIMKSGFSAEVDDEVYATLSFEGGVTAQLSVNWSDPSVRKMMTRVTIWGSKGRVSVDRQEVQLFLAEADPAHPQYAEGWNVRYITELTPPVSFYLRGEEYTAQLESFGNATRTDVRGPVPVLNDISSAAETDATIELIREAANSFSTESARPKGTVRHSGKGLSRLVFGRRV